MREWGRGTLILILRREATARLSHMVSLLIVKAHADRRAHERRLVAATTTIKTASSAPSELRRAVVLRTRPLLGRTTVRWLLRRHTVPVRRVLLLELLLWRLLGIVLRLLVRLRGIVWVVVLSRQRGSLRLHGAAVLLRRTALWRAVGMGVLLPLRAGVAALRARSLWAYIGPGILGIITRGRALRRAIVPGGMLVGRRRVKVAAAVTAAPTTASATTSGRALMLRGLRISVLRILLRVVGGRRARGRRRRRRRELVLLGSRHIASGLQRLAGGRHSRAEFEGTNVLAVGNDGFKVLVMSGEVCNGPRWVN